MATMSRRAMGAVTAPTPRMDVEDVLRHAVGATEVTVEIPATATLEDVEQTLGVAITGFERLSDAAERLKPVIGRILLTVQERKLYRPKYKNFTRFLQDRVVKQMGFGRSNAFEALRIARAFPHLKQTQYEQFGAKRLLLASQITSEGKEDLEEVLRNAQSLTVDDFRKYVIEIRQDRNAGRQRPAVIAIRCTAEVAGAWKRLLEQMPDTPVGDVFGMMVDSFRIPRQPKAAPGGQRPSAA